MTQTTYPPSITTEQLQEWHNASLSEAMVGASLVDLADDRNKWMHFMLAFSSWNSRFANGVAALASFIGEQKKLFKDPTAPAVVADRSNYIASFVFDAARDEYDDHLQEHRDTHRCLGQTTIMGAAEFFDIDLSTITEPKWLGGFNNNVLAGYTGRTMLQPEDKGQTPLPAETLHRIFQGLGYHLSSELLAARELTIIDTFLRAQQPNLVKHLLGYSATFAGGAHRGYAWIGNHSASPQTPYIKDVHFQLALKGINEALMYVPPQMAEECVLALRHGFLRFVHDHEHFFQRAGQAME